jgi:predicted Holliday junction resolvase-like endonuclease
MNTKELIKTLKSSPLIAQCPKCDEEFRLSDSLLFDGTMKFPDAAELVRMQLAEELSKQEKKLEKRKISVDVAAEKKAIEVGFGKIIEKFLPAYRDLDLQFTECRPLYDPIDVLVFSGLLNRKVNNITFLEIKSGNAKLNNHQKMIRDAVLDKNVDMRVLK